MRGFLFLRKGGFETYSFSIPIGSFIHSFINELNRASNPRRKHLVLSSLYTKKITTCGGIFYVRASSS